MAMGRRWSDSGYDDQGTSAHVSPALVESLKKPRGDRQLGACWCVISDLIQSIPSEESIDNVVVSFVTRKVYAQSSDPAA